MKIEFAESRPSGDFALVLPSTGSTRPGVSSLGDKAKIEAALERQKFDGDSGSSAELFIEEEGASRRLLIVGLGKDSLPAESAEKLGGAAVARLLKSGETHAVIDLGGLGFDADAAAKVALAAELRSWRYDRYHTKLKDKQKPSLKTVTIVGGGQGAADRWKNRWEPVAQGIDLTRSLVTEPATYDLLLSRCFTVWLRATHWR